MKAQREQGQKLRETKSEPKLGELSANPVKTGVRTGLEKFSAPALAGFHYANTYNRSSQIPKHHL